MNTQFPGSCIEHSDLKGLYDFRLFLHFRTETDYKRLSDYAAFSFPKIEDLMVRPTIFVGRIRLSEREALLRLNRKSSAGTDV